MVKLKYVLLIDDDHPTNVYHTVVIKRAQITDQIHTIEVPEIALEHIQKASKHPERTGFGQTPLPDIIFLDVNMPRMTGFEFLSAYQKIYENVKSKSVVFMLTAALHPADEDKYLSFDFVKGVLKKPLTVEILHSIMENHFKAEIT